MADQQHENVGEFDENAITNMSGNTHLNELIAARVSRRQLLGGGVSAGAAMMLGGFALTGCDDDSSTAATPRAPLLGFTAVARSTDDLVKIPAGYSFNVLVAVGDPLDATTPAWAGDGSETAASYEQRSGDHHDAIAYFGLSASNTWDAENSNRGLLVTNHEALTTVYLHQAGHSNTAPRNAEESLKEINAHGVSVIEIAKGSTGTFAVVRDSALNYRYTAQSPMLIGGPVAGSRFAVTRYSDIGMMARGTLNNCAHGETPWGTYLTGEENWAGYFARNAGDDALRSATDNQLLARYGINPGAAGRHRWSSVDPAADANQMFSRWNASVTGTSSDGSDDYRNEPNTFGWVVEIDPFTATATPKKRTLLGRNAHEGAWFAPAVKGQPLAVYLGDDSRNEYIYKFVSAENWDPADIGAGINAGDKYLDRGTLYVARFDANGTGRWIELAHGRNGLTVDNELFPFTSQAAVLVATRLAADAVGATKMDRPEWGCVNPLNGEVYITLTNNSQRSGKQDAANPRAYDADTGSYTSSLNGNVNGHIIRWREDGRNPAATSFAWDIYVFGSRAAYPANVNLSALDASNDMSSPDGIWFDKRGMLWIQTDDGAYTQGVASDATATNCMMLAAVPGTVGDGAHFDVPTATGTQRTYVGAAPGASLRRFLVGPKGSEITGVCMTPDSKTMFVNIQHPGEDGDLTTFQSHWPAIEGNPASTARPRSATIVISRDDGGPIGA